jgi:beta-lactamase regulating signal transducer with metallopeptidase domain
VGNELVSGDLVALLVDASLKALVFGVAADVGLRAARVKDAALSHLVWVSVAAGMLLFPAMRVYLPMVNVPLIPSEYDAESAYRVFGSSHAGLLLAVYAGGVVASLTRVFVGLGLAARLLAASVPVRDPRLDALVRAGLPARAWRRLPEVRESAAVRVPVTVGFARPRVLLPLSWRVWSADKLESVLAHEVAHVRRGDFAWQLLAELNVCFFWFHPVAWVLRRRLALAAERACDDSAVLAVGDHCRYARHLVDIAAELAGRRGRVAVGLPMADARQVRTRVESILDRDRQLCGRLRRGGAVFVAVLASVAWLSAAAVCWQRAAIAAGADASATMCPFEQRSDEAAAECPQE